MTGASGGEHQRGPSTWRLCYETLQAEGFLARKSHAASPLLPFFHPSPSLCLPSFCLRRLNPFPSPGPWLGHGNGQHPGGSPAPRPPPCGDPCPARPSRLGSHPEEQVEAEQQVLDAPQAPAEAPHAAAPAAPESPGPRAPSARSGGRRRGGGGAGRGCGGRGAGPRAPWPAGAASRGASAPPRPPEQPHLPPWTAPSRGLVGALGAPGEDSSSARKGASTGAGTPRHWTGALCRDSLEACGDD